MQDSDRDGHYKTKNTALAAYLRVEGFTLLDVANELHPVVFIFESDSKIQEYERNWQMGKTPGDCRDYYESYRLCLRMVRVGKL